MTSTLQVLIGAATLLAAPCAQAQQTAQPAGGSPQRISEGNGARQFGEHCRTCHGNPQVETAPDPAILKSLAPEKIYGTMTAGEMKEQAKNLSDADKRAIAEYLAGRRLGATQDADAGGMTNRCAGSAAVRDLDSAAWNGWGVDMSNSRFEPAAAARLSPAQTSRLALKWAFGVPGATSMYQQPVIVDGKVFFGSDSGYIYSLDADSGCVHWSFQAQSGVRSAMTLGPVKNGSAKYAAYFGDVHGNVYALDASNGELLWKISVDKHPLSRITGAPKLYQGHLYVPVASLEEVESGGPNYACCTFRGMLVALDANTGKQIWKTYTIQEEPKVIRKNSLGKDVYGPSGAGVWSSPVIDAKRRALYIVTGNAFSEPPTGTSDAILALDMDSGRILWSVQATAKDVWHGGCGRGIGLGRSIASTRDVPGLPYPPENCPEDGGPDQDFSGGAILRTLPGGKDAVIAGQKPGIIWAVDPDKQGALIWKSNVARANGNAGIIFGGAADDQTSYFDLRSGGVVAVNLSDGKEKWYTPLVAPQGMKNHSGASAAVSVIPGVVFSPSLDGMIRAFAADSGKLIWEFNTAREFSAVNGVKARGGSMGAPGPVIANGMLFVGSGYIGFQNGVPGNVLLAFAPAN